jgi:hypothetical protein
MVALVPVVTFPKLRLVGLAVSWRGVEPVPDSGTLREELDAFDVIARFPLIALADVGAKMTLKLTNVLPDAQSHRQAQAAHAKSGPRRTRSRNSDAGAP